MSATRCGFVAVVGRPNVGKSTLINALVGEKISIVTAKPQTTRHRILALLTDGATQIVFVDTPGLHRKAAKAMNRFMNRTAANALADADLVLFVTEAGRWTAEDADVLRRVAAAKGPVIAVMNKVDCVRPKSLLLDEIATLSERHEFAEILPVSAKKHDNLDALLGVIPAYLPESPFLFPEAMRTDRGPEFRAAEIVREKLTESLHQELPYGITVEIERYVADAGRVSISAVVWVERESQKGMVVGKDGRVLKRVGTAARLELAGLLDATVHLELWVKVRENWADSDQDLRQLGYESS